MTKAREDEPTQERLRELFRYNDGVLYWKERGPGRPISKPAGNLNIHGRVRITLDKGRYHRSRLIWILHKGSIQDGLEIDHINRDRCDDRIENFRLVTRRENNCNRCDQSQYGVGVSRDRNYADGSPRYQAQIRINGRKRCLGCFRDPDKAAEAYRKAKEKEEASQ